MLMTVYVPREGAPATAGLAPRSAIVGGPVASGIDCHYEGAVYGQVNLARFHQRLSNAASRRAERYPTTARGCFPVDSLLPVATYDAVRGVIVSVEDPELLTRWSGEDLAAMAGSLVPEGEASWTDAVAVVTGEGARPLGRHGGGMMLYRTLAGQVVRLDAMTRTARVFAHDDAALPGILEQAGLDPIGMRHAIGAAA